MTAGTFLDGAPVFELCAAQAGDAGTERLRRHLHEAAQALGQRRDDGLFRLAVDRVFTLAGHGTVVTGTAHAGLARAGDESADLRLMPAGERLRVRGIHAQNRPSETGAAGQRCALNLAGIDKNAIARGDWVADARCFLPSRHVDVELTLLPGGEADAAGAAGTVRAWTPLHVHIGAARHLAHAVPLSAETLAPGQSGWAQLVFDAPVCAMPGDRYIVRNAQATRTVGGGRVLDPNAPDRKRAARLQWLRALAAMLDGADLAPLLEQATLGLDEAALQRLTGRDARAGGACRGAMAGRPHAAGARTLILAAQWMRCAPRPSRRWRPSIRPRPTSPADGARLRMALPAMPDALWQVLLDDLQAQGRIARNGPWLHLPGHAATLSDDETALAGALLPLLAEGRYDPPWVRDLARLRGEPEERVRLLLRKLLRRGEVAQVVKDLFYHRDRVRELATLARGLAAAPAGLNAAAFRDATGLGRKRAIQILEFFDRVGYTRRVRDNHVLRGESAYALGQAAAEPVS